VSAGAGLVVVALVLLGAGVRAVLAGWALHVQVVPAAMLGERRRWDVAVWWEARSRGVALRLGPVGLDAGALRRDGP